MYPVEAESVLSALAGCAAGLSGFIIHDFYRRLAGAEKRLATLVERVTRIELVYEQLSGLYQHFVGFKCPVKGENKCPAKEP